MDANVNREQNCCLWLKYRSKMLKWVFPATYNSFYIWHIFIDLVKMLADLTWTRQ